jgi:hypothetical protein
MNNRRLEYFHVVSEHIGDRYFKVDWINNKCIQIVNSPGKEKKGKSSCIGVYTLAISSFRGTYHWYLGKKGNTQLLVTTENQFNRAFEKITNLLNS